MGIEEVTNKVNRNSLSLNKFFSDMSYIGKQLRDPELKKPSFNFADNGVTNYLLWLILAELMMINDNMEENIENA
jgi:hypothetical protein